MLVSNEHALLAPISAPDCKGCNVMMDLAKQQEDAGEHIQDDRLKVNLSQVLDPDASGQTRVDLLVTEKASYLVKDDGSRKPIPEEKSNLRVTAEWTDGAWRTTDFVLMKS